MNFQYAINVVGNAICKNKWSNMGEAGDNTIDGYNERSVIDIYISIIFDTCVL